VKNYGKKENKNEFDDDNERILPIGTGIALNVVGTAANELDSVIGRATNFNSCHSSWYSGV